MKDPRDIFRRFSAQAKKILTTSQQVAESAQSAIGSEHFLIGLAITPQTVAYELLKEYAITLEQIRLVLSLNDLWTRGDSGISDEARSVLTIALRVAANYKHEQIEPEHLLLAITSLRESRAYQVIARVGVDPNHLRRQLESILSDSDDLHMVVEPNLEGLTDEEHERLHEHIHDDAADDQPALGLPEMPAFRDSAAKTTNGGQRKGKAVDLYTTDLTLFAKQGKLDPVIGRDREILRTVQVLARRTKNNPVLIGEPGVGKTAIVEGLAQMIVAGNVPPILQNRRLLRLDLGLLVAGTMYRGQFEERLKRLLEEILKDSSIILFIDELHMVVGTGSAEGSMDAANMLKPALARGELRLIGATTLDDYRKSIEKDAALERRFQSVLVAEPSQEEALAILSGLRPKYEDYHHVRITQEAMEAAVYLSKRYMSERALPDKAIDLIDEAAAAKQISSPSSASVLESKLQQKLDQVIKQKERAIEREAFDRAAEHRTKELKLRDELSRLHEHAKKEKMPSIGREEIAAVVAQATGIPKINLIREQVRANRTDLEATLNQELIGQPEAVAAISAAIRRSQARITAPNRPLGSFMFLGPTGVGKTELARLLAREVFGSVDAMVKLDMSEFMERHNVARLVGAPPGYVGFEEGGKLTEIIRRKPYSLILLDEVEKAHHDVQNLLLQILEDGVLTDARGRRVSFANTIIVMTSNLGAGPLSKAQALGFQLHKEKEKSEAEEHYDELSAKVMDSVRDYFLPELLNRLDGTFVFRPLNLDAVRKIVDLQLTELQSRLVHEQYRLIVTPAARDWLAAKGFDPENGARPVRRTITETIENPLATLILDNEVLPGDTIKVTPRGTSLHLSVAHAGTKSKQTK